MKKLLSLFLSVLLIICAFSMVPASFSAAETGTTGDCTWTLDGTELTVSGNGKMGDCSYDLPWGSDITSVKIEDGVTYIGQNAFTYCSELEAADIADSVIEIGDGAFNACSKLKDINIPNNLEKIGKTAFYNCSKLETLDFPYTITFVGKNALKGTKWFDNCNDGLIIVGRVIYKYKGDMPSNSAFAFNDFAASISPYAFEDQYNLSGVILDGAINMGEGAFKGCYGLQYIVLSNGIERIEKNTFEDCTSLTDIIIPDTVTYIGPEAFSGCIALEEAVLPDSVTELGYSAFRFCYALKNLKISENLENIDDYTFGDCNMLESVNIPYSVKKIGQRAFQNCTSLTEIIIPDSVENVEYMAFYNCTGMLNATVYSHNATFGEYSLGFVYDEIYRKEAVKDDFTLYGYEGSSSEKYASDSNISFKALDDPVEYIDENTGICVASEGGAVLNVTDITDEKAQEFSELLQGKTVAAVYDISLLKDGKDFIPRDRIKVSIPCDYSDAEVYRAESDGTLTDMKAEMTGESACFNTEHLSIYVLAYTSKESVILGDADSSGTVNVSDVTIIQQILAKIDNDSFSEPAADVDGNKIVSVADATNLQKYIAKIETPYPIGEPVTV